MTYEEIDAVIRNSRRVAAFAVAGAFVIAPAVSGCGAGGSPQSAMPTQLTEGVNASTKTGIDIRNLFVLGPASGQKLEPGAAVPVYGVFINNGKGQADKLVGVTSPAFRQGARLASGGVDLPAANPVSLSALKAAAAPTPTPAAGAGAATRTPAAGAGTPKSPTPSAAAPAAGAAAGPAVVLSGLTQRLFGGETIDLILQFQQAGSLTLKVPVVPQTGEYTTYAPVPNTAPAAPAATPGATKKAENTPAPATTPAH